MGEIELVHGGLGGDLVTPTVPRETEPLDALEEALLELARSAIANRAEASGRRAKMAIIEPKRRGGRAA